MSPARSAETTIQNIITLLRDCGFTPSERVNVELARAAAPYRVAVLGQFKVGKSTLINRAFLERNVLVTDVLEATAVPIEVSSGPPKLEIVLRDGKTRSVDNPDPSALSDATTAQTPEGRALLARETERVRLTWPVDSLKGFDLIDTPGINSPNEAVVTTTFRIVPTCDAVVHMVMSRALSSIDEDFLAGRVFDEGVTQVLVLVNYSPSHLRQDEGERERIVAAIKARLASRGRPHVQVRMVSLDVDKPTSGVLGTAEEIRSLVSEFSHASVEVGRKARIQHVLAGELRRARLQVQAELASLSQSAEALEVTRQNLAEASEASRRARSEIIEALRDDCVVVRHRLSAAAFKKVEVVFSQYMDSLNAAEDLSSLHRLVEDAPSRLSMSLQTVCVDLADDLRRECTHLLANVDQRVRSSRHAWREIAVRNLEVDGGLWMQLPPAAVWLLDFVVSSMVGPFGWIGDLILRYLATKFPLLKKLVVVELVKSTITQAAAESLREALETARAEIERQLTESLARFVDDVATSVEKRVEEEESAIAAGVNSKVSAAEVAQRKALLEKNRVALDTGIAELSHS